MRNLRLFYVATALVWTLAATARADDPRPTFQVHEWGTFTALADDAGSELPGINIDDEPVPPFVHNLAPFLLNNPILSSEHWMYRQKGAPRQHPMVTLRLETPVLYFYPGPGGALPKSVDVNVMFRGGWLTEFYPYAKAELPGLKDNQFQFGPLTRATEGRLAWNDVQLNTRQPGPQTDEHVWLAPRKVGAVDLSVLNNSGKDEPQLEHERYLFYRGVANQQAPLRVATDRDNDRLTIRANFQDVPCKGQAEIRAAWLVDIRADGQLAFRTLPAFRVDDDRQRVVASTQRSFSAGDYARGNLAGLQQEMHRMLVADGLFEDEATAMLSTWQRAYFQTPGLRLFFTAPRGWTDHYLPLSISGDPEVTRVMLGRIELITDRQRELLGKVAEGKVDVRWLDKIPESAAKDKFLAGRSDFGDLGVEIPANYQAYLALGRFRNALVIAQARQHPSAGLERFIDSYNIRPYRWAEGK